ncbi:MULTISPECIES: lambda-exonuclease family protein [Xanthomonas]|uniref:lambda-exonuclease family protein n=1 Tax=Xanthomonas TaxID=338 RepID=UPI001ADBECCC|nr:YqaJ viral recombinase family protein [Xanthomonas phaseoli]MBO9766475.1 YqaJ viral recombinase family protein [Xanthomonas phaseoli pv. dieffenbachiae]MBO9776180.1 YqaJ viral recombinase family protein [Xanthomonas phaseoli pv. dieffenbachiae]MBO9778221.1 YqaJ viral recombinase family protein [Xanthomonas phaseoli pv. dieffenbachiae]MBO9795390.1 YqaJ viral recombinase family protein [Xanthomonas phaseoli pv. dieffenbachiae]MBO9801415.1 YqaJ viral recombinase family protein [Xanthomonas pha
MKTVNLIQGTPEWHAHRATHLNASDAPAMLGCSPYKTRAQLVREVATGVGEEHDDATLQRFADGHRYEALARSIAEQIIGEDLYPCVGEEGKYSASFDGLTLLEETAFEHKSLNDDLRRAMVDGCTGADLPLVYQVQMEHQAMVSGAARVLFMASKWRGDELVEERHCWYTPDPELRARVSAGWEQFEADVAAYEHVEKAEPVASGRAPDTLPSLHIAVTGMVTASNLAEFKASAMAVLSGINRELQTDDDFANAEQTVKWCKGVEERLEATKQQILGQTADIDAVFRTMDDVAAEARRVRLELDKLVKVEKDNRRSQIVANGVQSVREHYASINAGLDAHALAVPVTLAADIGAVIKGKKSISSMQDAVGAAAANAKIAASQQAERVRANVRVLEMEMGTFAGLFHDRVQLCATKSPEDLRNLITARITEQKRVEEQRLEAQREKIRQEETDKLAREQQEREEAQRLAEAVAELARRATAVPSAAVSAPAPVAAAPAALSPALSQPAKPLAAQAPVVRIKLGDINAKIAPLTITADGLAQLGFLPVTTERASKLYDSAQLPAMFTAMQQVFARAATTSYQQAA